MFAVDGTTLSCAEIEWLAHTPQPVRLTDAAWGRLGVAHKHGDDIARRLSVYGRTTGVGANRDQPVQDRDAAAVALLRSHATAAGPPRAPERVRGMLLVRLNQLAAGGSGIQPEIAQALSWLVGSEKLPVVRELGSIGTGDLAPLAAVARALSGELSDVPVPYPVAFKSGDALAFLSSNAATLADSALAARRLSRLGTVAIAVATLSGRALRANWEAFSPGAERATPFPGTVRVARAVREWSEGAAEPRGLQDPFGLRAFPQVHGALLDALDWLGEEVEVMANAAAENPLLHPEGGLAHHGGFFAARLAQGLDGALVSLSQSAQTSLSRLSMMNDPRNTGLPPFLADGTPGASGVMLSEYVAASALGRLRVHAHPVSVQTVSLSLGVEEDATFAPLAATQALTAVEEYRTMLAVELFSAVRCLRRLGLDAGPLAATLAEASRGSEFDVAGDHDRDLSGDLAAAEQTVETWGELLRARESEDSWTQG